MPTTEYLRRRNALWRRLRSLEPGPAFEAALRDLCALTGWSRARVLAGLGLDGADAPGAPAAPS